MWQQALAFHARMDASHYAQVQFEMFVTQKQHAYLVYWSCKATHIFKIGIDCEWLQEALALLRNIQQQYLSPTPLWPLLKIAIAKCRRSRPERKHAHKHVWPTIVSGKRNVSASQPAIRSLLSHAF